MRTAANVLLAAAAILGLCLPADAQFYSRGNNFAGGSSFGGAMGGGAFGGGSAFGNGSVQMYNPALNNLYSPYRYGGGYPGYGYGGPGYGFGVPGYGYPTLYGGGGAFGAPAVVPGLPGYFRIEPLGGSFWRSPSGYYYPWGLGATTMSTNTIYYVNQGQTQAQNPPIYSMLNDMRSFLDDSRKSGRLSDADYRHLFRRVEDIQGKYDHMVAENGSLDQTDEDSIRRDAAQLGAEISQRVKPLSSSSESQSSSSSGSPGRGSSSGSGWVEDK